MACEIACQGCVLVVDDDPAVRDALREHIARLGCRVLLADDGLAGLESLDQALPLSPCVILADLTMPRLDGVALAETVRSRDGHARTPIVTMSAEPRRERPRDVELHLEKPFAFDALAPTIARLCRGGPARDRVRGVDAPDPAGGRDGE